MCSAAAFFDSPVAIRVFGELFADPRFERARKDFAWFPLRLNTDNPKAWETPNDYVIARWRDPNIKLGLFRESDNAFSAAAGVDIVPRKMAAAEYLSAGQYARLRNAYEPFLADFEVPHYDDPSGLAAARIPPLLTEDFSQWLRAILLYLSEPGCFSSMAPDVYGSTLSAFSPLSAVKRRSEALPQDAFGNYNVRELHERTLEFERVVGNSPMMNAFHRHGPSIYGHYFALINHWIEVDWHTTRHAAYGSSTCLLSSNWEEREVFGFDPKSKIHYSIDAEIDDSLRRTQEKFGELDWGVLFDVVSDPEWQSLIWKIRDADGDDEVTAASDRILNLLAGRIADFTFNCDNGRLAIAAKNVSTATSHATAAGLVTSLFDSTLGGLLGVGKSLGVVGRVLAPGAQWTYGEFAKHQLRTAVVPKIYLD